MKILIVGGNSSIAKALKLELLNIAEVFTAGRSNCDFELDLSASENELIIPDDINIVINAAADFGGECYSEIFQAEYTNALGGLKLCHACVKFKVKHFIQISSISTYLDSSSSFYNSYSLSKKHADELIQLYCSTNKLLYTILRPSRIYGSEEVYRKHQPFLYALIDKAEKSEDIQIYGSQDPLRNFLHIEDFTTIISKILFSKLGGIFSCAFPENIRLSEIAHAANLAFNSSGKIAFLKDKNNIEDNIFPYNPSLYDSLKYLPQISMAEGMNRIANYRSSKST